MKRPVNEWKTAIRGVLRRTSFRLTISLLISVIVIVSILSAFSYKQSVRIVEQETADAVLQTVERTGKHLEHMLREYASYLDMMVYDQELLNKLIVLSTPQDAAVYERTELELAQLLRSYTYGKPLGESITVFSLDYHHVVSTFPNNLIHPMMKSGNAERIRQIDWIHSLDAAEGPTVFLDAREEAFVSTNPQEAYFAVARKMSDPLNPSLSLGMILLEVSTAQLHAALDGSAQTGNSGYVILSEQGRIVDASEPALARGSLLDASILEEVMAGNGRGGTFTSSEWMDRDHYYVYYETDPAGWYVLSYYPREELLEPVRQLLWNFLWLAVVCSAVAAICVGYLVHRGVGIPLRHLHRVMREGEAGNIAVRTTDNPDNEIGDLGRAFNQMMEQITLAYHDTLTSLPNRRFLIEKIEQLIEEAQTSQHRFAVLFMDLDRFKDINDTLGHHAGDQLIQKIAKRLLTCMREGDTVARIAGDEFVALLPLRESDTQEAEQVAASIMQAVRRPCVILGQEILVTTSIGAAVYPKDAADAEGLLQAADRAMYEAKASGKDAVVAYRSTMDRA
ncbi:diguanylate cyclase [Xylanibacillus composti]|uniref:Diguanylate cyclase (GGDEF)-like protein n=1 Tax=Xylanibacillus composti TaxID=1572762 RepID=A0A8J4H739_9BACL|nr:diguanylate cyclase [Xylanibacillus composti]MDT9725736.1 diguanylate cyclase [Xylanibacillus composti]GIQ71126.1 hypothetical protein XYCOK13_39500 [Xylanibacillus composti]